MPPSVPTRKAQSSRPKVPLTNERAVPPKTQILLFLILANICPLIGYLSKLLNGSFQKRIFPSVEMLTKFISKLLVVNDSVYNQMIYVIGSLWKYSSASLLQIKAPVSFLFSNSTFQIYNSPLIDPPAKMRGFSG